MSIWRIYGIKKWFIISLIALVIIWGAFFTALGFYFVYPSHLYIYLLVFLGLYASSSIYVLLKQSLFRFIKFTKMGGEIMQGKIIYEIPSTGEASSRPLAIIEVNNKKRVVALLAMFPRSFKKVLKEGDKVTIYKIIGEQIALLLTPINQ